MSPRSKTASPTLRQVAQLAGVSQATASKVLNGRADVSAATRERVLQVIDDAGYRARSVRPADTGRKRVAAILDSLSSQYGSLVLDGMVLAAADLGVEVSVLRTPPDFADPTRKAARAWVHQHQAFAGVIAVTSSLPAEMIRTAAQLNLPLITIDPADESQADLVSISSTDWTGGRSMTEHLLELGHRRIAWVGGPSTSAPTIERFHGYRSALERVGVAVDPTMCRNGPYSFEAGIEAGLELLHASPRPTAIICASDAIAFGVLESARREGVQVPWDLSVGGFDDIPQAEWMSPKLTSVRAPLIGIGRMAIETIMGMSMGKEPASHHIQLATRLIVRESTAPPAAIASSPDSSSGTAGDALPGHVQS